MMVLSRPNGVVASPAAFAAADGLPGLLATASDRESRLLWCNRAYADRFGKNPEELIGSTVWDRLPATVAAAWADLVRPVHELGVPVSSIVLWQGERMFCKSLPLDPAAFGAPGAFTMILPLDGKAPEGADTVRFLAAGDFGDLARLSPRELEVFYHLATGMTVNEIAEAMFRSRKTIGRHVESIHAKLRVSNRAELVRIAAARGITAFTAEQWRSLVRARSGEHPRDAAAESDTD